MDDQNSTNEKISIRKESKSTFNRIINIIEVAIAIFFIYVFLFGSDSLIITDLIAKLNGNDYIDNPYLEMVLNHKPFDEGESYYSAFSRTFDDNEWTYFKSNNGQRIVQVISTYKDILNDKMITQFAISPTDEKGYFLIEPYAMRVSGRDLTEYEMNLVLAAVFDNEVVNALGELFLYSSFY